MKEYFQVIDPSAILEDMQHYGEVGYEAKTASWDEMQKDLRLVDFKTVVP